MSSLIFVNPYLNPELLTFSARGVYHAAVYARESARTGAGQDYTMPIDI
jgi:hypothetical protein